MGRGGPGHQFANYLGSWRTVGAIRFLHRLRQVRAGLPTGALFAKGKSIAEMQKDRSFLKYIVTAREKQQWRVE